MFSRGVVAAFSPEIPEKKLPNPGMVPTAPQYRLSSARACSGPPRTKPSTRTAPFMAPALVPVTPMISIVASSSRRSSTPHVKAPCDPPPCNAKATLRRPGAAPYCASAFDDALPIMSASKVTGILGSTYADGMYAFWHVMGELFGAGPSLAYRERVALLQSVGVRALVSLQDLYKAGQSRRVNRRKGDQR